MVVMVIVLVVYGILFAMQPKAAANILAPMINVDVTVMTWVMGIIFVIQALVGLKGIAAMNVVHSSILYIGCVVVGILAWNHVGSLDLVRETLGGSYLSVTQPSVSSVIGNAAGGLFAFILSTSLVANIYSAKSKKTANAGVLAAAVLVIIFAFFPALIGIFGKIMYPDAEARLRHRSRHPRRDDRPQRQEGLRRLCALQGAHGRRPRKRAVKPHRSIIRPAGPRPGRRLMTRGIKNVSI